MEYMTEAERKKLRDLQAKEKRVARAEAEFLKEADKRKNELIQRWNMSDRMQKAAAKIGTDPETLFKWIVSDEAIQLFHRTH